MQLVRFSMPIVSQWTEGETSIDEALGPVPISSGLTKDEVLERFKEVFTGLGRLKVEPVKIHLTKDAKPVRRPCRRVPIAIRGKFKDELDSLCKEKVLTKLDKMTASDRYYCLFEPGLLNNTCWGWSWGVPSGGNQ